MNGVNRSSQRNKDELERAKKRTAEVDRAVREYQSSSWEEKLEVDQGGSSGSRRGAKAGRSWGGMSKKQKMGRREWKRCQK